MADAIAALITFGEISKNSKIQQTTKEFDTATME